VNGAAASTAVRLDAGQATVLLPPNVAVRVHCHADIGEVDCLGQHGVADGPDADVRVVDPGVNVPPGSAELDLDVSVRTGSVEVRRG